MAETTMTVTEYCNHADLSRTAFYEHRKHGVLDGCFTRKPGYRKDFVVVEKADKALTENIRWNPGGQATKRKHKKRETTPEPPETDDFPESFEAEEAGMMMHFVMASEFGLVFRPLEGPIPLKEMEKATVECLDLIFSYLAEIATGEAEDPAASAAMAVLYALIGSTAFEIDYEKLEKRPHLLAELDKLKKKKGKKQ